MYLYVWMVSILWWWNPRVENICICKICCRVLLNPQWIWIEEPIWQKVYELLIWIYIIYKKKMVVVLTWKLKIRTCHKFPHVTTIQFAWSLNITKSLNIFHYLEWDVCWGQVPLKGRQCEFSGQVSHWTTRVSTMLLSHVSWFHKIICIMASWWGWDLGCLLNSKYNKCHETTSNYWWAHYLHLMALIFAPI